MTQSSGGIDTVLFDLDGTLTDPFAGITRSIQHALAALEIGRASCRERV